MLEEIGKDDRAGRRELLRTKRRQGYRRLIIAAALARIA
jgi:hypothetical protein